MLLHVDFRLRESHGFYSLTAEGKFRPIGSPGVKYSIKSFQSLREVNQKLAAADVPVQFNIANGEKCRPL
jgi:hypothetical protein